MLQCRHLSIQIKVNMGSGSGLLSDGTKPLPKPMMTTHKSGSVPIHHSNFPAIYQATIMFDEFEECTFCYNLQTRHKEW